MSGLTYLITGANRGIGFGLLSTFILRPNTTVIAAVRDVEASTKVLSSVPKGNGSKLIIVKIDSTSATDPTTAAADLKTKYGITKIDVLLSNAGLLGLIKPVLETPLDAVRQHFEVNTLAPLALLQAFFPLLEASEKPRFFVISSTLGSIGQMESFPVPFFAYGISKAAANYLVRKVHFENPKVISQAFHPGWVQTDMGNGAAQGVGMEAAPVTIEDSVKGLVILCDKATRESSGTFAQAGTDAIAPW